MVPCVALALRALMELWWRGIEGPDHGMPVAVAAVVLFAVAGVVAFGASWLFDRCGNDRALERARWLPRLQRFAAVLAAPALLLVLAATVRRADCDSPDGLSRLPKLVHSRADPAHPERVLLRLDDRHDVVAIRPPNVRYPRLYLRDSRASQLRFIGLAVDDTYIQFDRRLGCVRVVNFGRGTVRCLASPDRAATAWTERRSLAPTFSWLSMGVIGVGLLLYATRQREHRRWRRAVANVDESVTVDGVRFDAGRGVKIPHNRRELWVVTDERTSGSGPYRQQSTREVLEVRVEPPFERDWRETRWAIASALLFLTPLVFALWAGMITG